MLGKVLIVWPLCIVIISDTMEARYLYNYAQSLELLDDDPLNNPEASLEGYNCKYFMQMCRQELDII